MNLFDEPEVLESPAASTATVEDAPAAPAAGTSIDIDSDVVIFDIETGPIDEDLIHDIIPAFDPASISPHPGEFETSSVKLGNIKDKAKIAEKIEAAREKHNAAVTEWNRKASTARSDYWQAALSKAALSPITGRVLAIGYGDANSLVIDEGGGDEIQLLTTFWEDFDATGARYSGWNISGFDVWFMVNRSRLLGIPHPEVLDRGCRYLSMRFIELMDLWNCGSRSFYDPFAGKSKTGAKAKDIAKVLGVGRPADATPVKHGGQFAEYWNGTEKQKEQAREYLRWDIREEVGIAQVFGVL